MLELVIIERKEGKKGRGARKVDNERGEKFSGQPIENSEGHEEERISSCE